MFQCMNPNISTDKSPFIAHKLNVLVTAVINRPAHLLSVYNCCHLCHLQLKNTTGEVQAGVVLQRSGSEARVRGRSGAGESRGEIPSQLRPPQDSPQPPGGGAALWVWGGSRGPAGWVFIIVKHTRPLCLYSQDGMEASNQGNQQHITRYSSLHSWVVPVKLHGHVFAVKVIMFMYDWEVVYRVSVCVCVCVLKWKLPENHVRYEALQ